MLKRGEKIFKLLLNFEQLYFDWMFQWLERYHRQACKHRSYGVVQPSERLISVERRDNYNKMLKHSVECWTIQVDPVQLDSIQAFLLNQDRWTGRLGPCESVMRHWEEPMHNAHPDCLFISPHKQPNIIMINKVHKWVLIVMVIFEEIRQNSFLTSKKRGPSCPNWGEGEGRRANLGDCPLLIRLCLLMFLYLLHAKTDGTKTPS